MKQLILLATGLFLGLLPVSAQTYSSLWQIQDGPVPSRGTQQIKPDKYRVFRTSETALQSRLAAIGADPDAPGLIELPVPDGTYRTFRIWETPMMEKGLTDRYPGIRTYTATAEGSHTVTAKIDYTPFGFHAMVFDGANSFFVDPYSNAADGYYLTYFRKDLSRPVSQMMTCGVQDEDELMAGSALHLSKNGLPGMQLRMHGTQRRTYRLALACTGEYAVAVAGTSPTKTAVLAKMVTSVNRVNGIYERELAVTMQLIATNDTLIFLDAATDPYTNNSGGAMLGQNQTAVTNRVGSANYDFGHVFSTGGGGIAQLGCICRSNSKARGVTGSPNPVGDAFDIDYVAHEMGHQFGSNHTFNNNNAGSCAGNAVQSVAYEPGSGSTIMAYAGICGSGNNIQQNSDAYFHSSSLEQITDYLNNATGGDLCPVKTTSPNVNATMGAFTATHYIPFKTPFELTAPAALDATKDELTYCWEQRDLGDFGLSLAQTRLSGPLFRSFMPDTARTRVFPVITRVVTNTISYNAEKLPDTGRTMNFKLTQRDIYQGFGCFNFPDDVVTLNVVHTGNPFAVTTPNVAGILWITRWQHQVTWNVVGTNAAPINCANVDIYLSVDGGYTYPYLLKANTPNDGSEMVTLPPVATTKARIKVKGAGNVFFDISNSNFTIEHWPASVGTIPLSEVATLSPVPARESVTVRLKTGQGGMKASVINAVGQLVWSGDIDREATIAVGGWAKGVYYLRLANESTQAAQPFVVE